MLTQVDVKCLLTDIRKLLNLIVFSPTVDTFNAYKANFCQLSLPPI